MKDESKLMKEYRKKRLARLINSGATQKLKSANSGRVSDYDLKSAKSAAKPPKKRVKVKYYSSEEEARKDEKRRGSKKEVKSDAIDLKSKLDKERKAVESGRVSDYDLKSASGSPGKAKSAEGGPGKAKSAKKKVSKPKMLDMGDSKKTKKEMKYMKEYMNVRDKYESLKKKEK
jgi:hypothetical protein